MVSIQRVYSINEGGQLRRLCCAVNLNSFCFYSRHPEGPRSGVEFLLWGGLVFNLFVPPGKPAQSPRSGFEFILGVTEFFV